MRLTLLVLFLALSFPSLKAQDWTWWNDLVNWDGETPWQEYLALSSEGLGPNALPVPFFRSLGVSEGFQLNNELRYHHNPQDPTFDYRLRIDYGFNKIVGISAWIVPLEYYNTSIELRDERKIRQFDPRGWTVGDFYFGTYFHLLREEVRALDIIVSANMKTASGNQLEGGRATDTPGYYFDALFAKTFQEKFRPYLAGGLYVYQTYDGLHFQNDAFLYAAGFHYFWRDIDLNLEWSGYYGYLNNGDRPSVARLNLSLPLSARHLFRADVQLGLNDLNYHTYSLGYTYLY